MNNGIFGFAILSIVLLVATFSLPILHGSQSTALLVGPQQQSALNILTEYETNVGIVGRDIVKLDQIVVQYNPAYNPLDYRSSQSGTYLRGGFNVRPARVIEAAVAYAREYLVAREHFLYFKKFLENNKEALISAKIDVLVDQSQINDIISNYDSNLEGMKIQMKDYEQREEAIELSHRIEQFWKYANQIEFT